MWIGFWSYGKALAYLGKCGPVARNLGGFFVYLMFSCLLVSPVFLALTYLESWREEFNNNLIYIVYFMFLFLISTAPGAFHFKRYYFRGLQEMGYFSKRR